MSRNWLSFALCGLMLGASPVHADVVISSGTTSNMSCSAGVCEPTATSAVLNVSDLENMLASGNVTVTTTGSGVQADSIDVKAALSWSTQTSLTLDASEADAIDQEVSVAGEGGLSLTTNGEIQGLTFGRKGRVVFQNLSSQLTINGTAFVLVNDIASLASAISSNPTGSYAFADDYDASQDGTYSAAPIATIFQGTFDGLGNTISHLSIDDQLSTQQFIGFFSWIAGPALVEHVHVAGVKIVGGEKDVDFNAVGAVVGENENGYLFQDTATGQIRVLGKNAAAGGLVGAFTGSIDTSSADVTINAKRANRGSWAGGLVGVGTGLIATSFATGSIVAGNKNHAGGLIGANQKGSIQNSYSTGAVTGGVDADVGGLMGNNDDPNVLAVYSSGAVSGGSPSYVGGFAGSNAPRLLDGYWDTDTSGTTQAVGRGNSRGITGLTTQQLQSGLPAGFDRKIWAENPNINNGFPYLIHNPPPK